jgi:hypothetical protein
VCDRLAAQPDRCDNRNRYQHSAILFRSLFAKQAGLRLGTARTIIALGVR